MQFRRDAVRPLRSGNALTEEAVRGKRMKPALQRLRERRVTEKLRICQEEAQRHQVIETAATAIEA